MGLALASFNHPLTARECGFYIGTACPEAVSPADVQYRDGVDVYADQEAGLGEAEVTIAVSSDSRSGTWSRDLDAIAELWGLNVREFCPDGTVRDAVAHGMDADVYLLDAPRQLQDVARFRPLLDLRSFIDEATLLDDYGSNFVSLSRLGRDGTWPSDTGPIRGVMVNAESRAVVWTKEPAFADSGYVPPSDWSSFMALGDLIVADGRTPLCLGLGSTGWPAADWVEMVVLRTGGPEFDDSWIRHDVPFDDPVVVDAIRTVGEVAHRPGFLDVSPVATAQRGVDSAMVELVQQPGVCLMTLSAGFLPTLFEGNTELGVASSAFPTFGTDDDDAIVGTSRLAVAVTDRPEVRNLMTALASPSWGLGSSELEWFSPVPLNARFDVTRVANPEMAEIVSALQASVRAGNFRLDASDAMPPEVASAFLDGMLRLFRDGSLDDLAELSLDIAQDIDAAWRELEGAG